MTTAYRNRLSVSALAAATSFIALAAPAAAQSVCTQSTTTTTTFTCSNGTTVVVNGTFDAGASVGSATEGLVITDTAALNGTVSGNVGSTLSTDALFAGATTDLTLGGVSGSYLNVANTGTGNAATLLALHSITGTQLGNLSSVNGYAIQAVGGTGVNLTVGTVSSTAVNTTPITLPISPVLTSVTGSTVDVPVGAGAAVIAVTGDAAITASSVTVAGSADPLIGILAYAPAGSASTTVTGNVSVTKTGAGNAIGAAALGSTGASVNVGGTTTGTGTDEATGLAAVTSTGTASITAGGAVNVSAADATGIRANGDTVLVSGPTATITATDTDTGGIDAIGIQAVAVNGVTVNTGKVTSSGTGIVAASTSSTGSATAPVSVTVNGVQAGTTGIIAVAGGATPITVTASAPVVAGTGAGIIASGANGLVTVNEAGVTGTTVGVLAVAGGTGSVAVTATGGTTTATGGNAIVAAAPGGSATVTVNSGATVTGQGASDAISVASGTGTGMTTTVNVAGTVNVAPTGTGNAITTAGGPATVNVNNHGNLSGPIVLGGADNVIAVNSGGTFTAGSVDFGTGNTALTVATGGTLTLNSATDFAGLQTLSNGGTTTLTGDVVLAGPTTFTNTGTVKATGGATSLSGPATFSNAGTISMVDGDTTDVLTLGTTGTPMNYVGVAPNARLAVDVNGAVTASDKLVVTGTSSGTTLIAPTFVGGVASYNPTGTVVVNTGGTPAAGTFVIDPTTVKQGWLNAGVVSAAATGGGTNVFVRTTLDSSVTDLALVRSLGQDMWYQSFDAYDDAVRGRHAGSLTTGQPIGIWGQLYASGDSHGDKDLSVTTAAGNVLTYSGELRTLRKGAQVGIEYRAPGFVIGATGGYEKAENRDSTAPSQISADGHNWGIYALVGMENGLYAGVLYKRDDQDIRFFNTVRGVSAYFNNARSEGADGEVGFKGTAGSIGFDLQGGVSYVKTSIGTNSAQGLYFRWDNNKSVRGRLGARVFFPQALGFYLGAKVIHEFNDPADFHVVDISTGLDAATIVGQNRGTWARVEAGVDSLGIKGLMLSVWGDAGKTKSIGGRVGFRF